MWALCPVIEREKMKFEKLVINNGGIPYLTTPDFAKHSELAAGFSTREGGVSAPPFDGMNFGFRRGDNAEHVKENYRLFANAIGALPEGLCAVRQVHSDKVLVMPEDGIYNPFVEGEIADADGSVCGTAGIFPVCYFADCIPILLYEPSAACFGAVHSGWRGTKAGIVGNAVRLMKERYGADPSKIIMAIGPSICPSCFEVGEEVAEQFDKKYVIGGYNKPHIDLWSVCEDSAVAEGVDPSNITCLGMCTMEQKDLFFSHRAHGEVRGVLMAAIGIKV